MFNKFPIEFNYDGIQYHGQVQPLQAGVQNRMPTSFQVFFNNVYYGLVKRRGTDWETDSPKIAIMVDKIGNHIYSRYED